METPKTFLKFHEAETLKSNNLGSNFPSSNELLIFWEMELYSFKKLNKTPTGETECLSNH